MSSIIGGLRNSPATDSKEFRDDSTGFKGWQIHIHGGKPIPTPAIGHDRVFVGGGFGSFDYFAFDAASGARVWHVRTTDDGPTAAVLSEGYVIFNTESCTIEVVAAATGQVAWEKWLGDPLLGQPAAMDGRIFMVYPNSGEHRLGAFSLREGKPLWETKLDHDVITAPVVAEGKLYLSTFDGMVSCIDPVNGRIIWRQQQQATSAPWIFEGDVYVAHREDAPWGDRQTGDPAQTRSGQNLASQAACPSERTSRFDSSSGMFKSSSGAKLAAYLSDKSGLERKQAYSKVDSMVGFASPPSSAKLHAAEQLIGERLVSRAWRFQGSRPVVVNGILYDTTGDRLEASDARTGKFLWSWENASRVEGERKLTPPAVANGRVWAGTWDGRILSWEALTGKVRWEVAVGAPCHWQPAVSNGWVYAGLEDGSLVAFATGDPLDTDWSMWGGGSGHNGQPRPECDSSMRTPTSAVPSENVDLEDQGSMLATLN